MRVNPSFLQFSVIVKYQSDKAHTMKQKFLKLYWQRCGIQQPGAGSRLISYKLPHSSSSRNWHCNTHVCIVCNGYVGGLQREINVHRIMEKLEGSFDGPAWIGRTEERPVPTRDPLTDHQHGSQVRRHLARLPDSIRLCDHRRGPWDAQ